MELALKELAHGLAKPESAYDHVVHVFLHGTGGGRGDAQFHVSWTSYYTALALSLVLTGIPGAGAMEVDMGVATISCPRGCAYSYVTLFYECKSCRSCFFCPLLSQ